MPRRTTTLLGSVALAAATLSTPAQAAPGFISDVTTLTAHQSAGQYAVALAPDGTAHAIWIEERGTAFVLMASRRPPGGAWTTPTAVDTGSRTQDAEPSLAVDGDGRAVAAWRDYLPDRTGSVIRTATLSDGTWGTARDLSPTTTHAFEPEVAVDASGDAAIVWTQDLAGSDGRHLVGAQRPAGGAWATSDITSGPGAAAATVAVQPDGRAVALWTQAGTVQSADRPLGRDWSGAHQLSASNGLDVSAVVDADGQVVAAWRSASTSGPSTIETATRAASGVWGASTTLATATSGLAWQLDLGVGKSGEALAAWVVSGAGNTTSDLFTASRAADGDWTTRSVTTPQAYNSSPTVGFGAGGASVVMWTGSTGQLTNERTLYAVTRTPGRAWAEPTALASGSVASPLAAVDSAGHGTLLWSEYGGALRSQVFDGVAPEIERFRSTTFATRGQQAYYTARASDVWSNPSLAWHFDGSAPVAGARAAHSFGTTGVHRVLLTATDAADNTTTREGVTIVAARKPRLRKVDLRPSVIHVEGSGAASSTTLTCRLSAPALVRVTVANRSGRVVATVVRALDAGRHSVSLTAKRLHVGSGKYTVRVSARNALGRAVSTRMPLRGRR